MQLPKNPFAPPRVSPPESDIHRLRAGLRLRGHAPTLVAFCQSPQDLYRALITQIMTGEASVGEFVQCVNAVAQR